MTRAALRHALSSKSAALGLVPSIRDGLGYLSVSIVALFCDYVLLLSLMAVGVHYLVASFLSFSLGSAVAYALCVRFVFAGRRAASREAEILGFFAVGLAGLALTQLLLYVLVSRFGIPVAVAKIPIVGIVFLFNFFGRSRLVFVGGRVIRRNQAAAPQ